MWYIIVLEKLILAKLLKIFHPYMKPEGSLQCSEDPTTEPHLEPAECGPQLHISFTDVIQWREVACS
jgi:hypothetical protein